MYRILEKKPMLFGMKTLACLALVATLVAGKGKDRAWQQGFVVDAGVARAHDWDPIMLNKTDVWSLTIDGNNHRYMAEAEHVQGLLAGHGVQPLHLEVNGMAMFAVEKDYLFVIDPLDGKERKLKIVKVIALP